MLLGGQTNPFEKCSDHPPGIGVKFNETTKEYDVSLKTHMDPQSFHKQWKWLILVP